MRRNKYFFPKHKFRFLKGTRNSFTIRAMIEPVKWVEKNFILTRSYAAEGRIRLYNWQKFIINCFQRYPKVILIGPVQTGKSLLCECIIAFLIDVIRVNMMLIYEKKEKVMNVFDERLSEMIKKIPVLKQYWSGVDADLTKTRIKLNHLIIRVASAGVESDISTFAAGVVYGSEIAKWPKKSYSQMRMIEGRQQSSRMVGKKTFTLLETSPREEGDMAYIECHKSGVRYVKPHFKCIHCSKWILINDRNIFEIPNRSNKKDHDPDRIRKEKAARFLCPKCKKEITENQRLKMSFHVIYAAVALADKYRTIETIDEDGNILDMIDSNTIVINWNRLVDNTWTFAECLASYFSALTSLDPRSLTTYLNEDMANWVKTEAERLDEQALLTKRRKYFQFGNNASIPDDVIMLLIGIDTQDNGFYYVVKGIGYQMKQWVIRHDFIECGMKDDQFQNPAEVFRRLYDEVHRFSYKKSDGYELPIFFGLIDEGGHRKKDVDYIVNHWPAVCSYKGEGNAFRELIARNPKSGIYHGNTEQLSRLVHRQLESRTVFFPEDVGKSYLEQVVNQYEETVVDSKGNKKKLWVGKDPDHYRDCENMLTGATIVLELRKKMFDFSSAEGLKKDMIKDQKTGKQTSNDSLREQNTDRVVSNAVSSLMSQMDNMGFGR